MTSIRMPSATAQNEMSVRSASARPVFVLTRACLQERRLERLDRDIDEYKATKLAAAEAALREARGEEEAVTAMDVDGVADEPPAPCAALGRGVAIQAPRLIAPVVQAQREHDEALKGLHKSKGCAPVCCPHASAVVL